MAVVKVNVFYGMDSGHGKIDGGFVCFFFFFFYSVIVATAKSVEWIHCHIGGATRFVR